MVTNYLNKTETCGYKIDKLKNHIFLYDDKKSIIIDHQNAYISGATGTPIVLSGFDISFVEETSLDERYKFTKTLKISINGRLNKNSLPDTLYAIIESKDGTYFFTNPDFPYKLTYVFNLAEKISQTDITLTCSSNMPTLELHTDKLSETNVCKSYQHNGIKSLKLLEKDKVNISTLSGQVVTTEEWKTIEYTKNSCSLQENYDGSKVTATIQFDIDFSSYKSDWQYRLLEFKDNLYTAIVEANDYYKYYVGFISGLEANYNISTYSNDNQNAITISLVETSNYGIDTRQDLTEYYNTVKRWVYVKYINGVGNSYECYGMGMARFFMMAEVDYFGNQTGKYKMLKDDWDCLHDDDPDVDHSYCIEKYGAFLQLNIVGTFDDVPNVADPNTNYFPTIECAWYRPPSDVCVIDSDIPNLINFTSQTSYTYTFKASCDWSVTEKPTYITVLPTSGVGESSYTMTVANTLEPSEIASGGTIAISCCNKSKNINVTVQEPSSCIYPEQIYINCMAQPVQFSYDGNCLIEVSAVTKDDVGYSGLTYSIANNQLIVNVPDNFTNNFTTYKLYITNCGCNSGLTQVTITQRRQYEMWVAKCSDPDDDASCDYICSGTSKYKKEYRYTGTSTVNWELTGEFRQGDLITSASTDCSKLTRFSFLDHYVCIEGSKYQLLEEEESIDNGITWTTTGVAKLGDWIEDDSSFCEQETTYEWRITTNWICLPT